MGMKPFVGYCYECNGWHEFVKPRKIRALTESDVEALIVRFNCSSCGVGQDFVLTPLHALEAGLKSV